MLKSRNWFPVNTEIYTAQGWVNIASLETKSYDLIGYDDGELIQCNLRELNKRSFKGQINRMKNKEGCLDGFYLGKKIIRYNYELDLPKLRKLPYNGYLYNIVTTCNSFIMRNHTKKYNYNDYNIIQCQTSIVR